LYLQTNWCGGTAILMAKKPTRDPKTRALQQEASLHPHPELVTDELFLAHEFFDPRDLVQVKYEMLRRVQSEGQAVSQSAAHFGFSRPSFYQAQAAFQQGGLPALMPQKRGPKTAHKLTAEVLAFVRQARQENPSLRPPALVSLVKDRYDITVHPRSMERALTRSQKKLR
jgi:transposase